MEDLTGGGEDLGISDDPESDSDHDKGYNSDYGDEDSASSLDLASSFVRFLTESVLWRLLYQPRWYLLWMKT